MNISPSSNSSLDTSCCPESANYQSSKMLRLGLSPLRKEGVRMKLDREMLSKPWQHWKSPFTSTDHTPDHKI